jgi:integrase
MNDDIYTALKEARELALTDHVIEFNGKRIMSVKHAFARLCKDCGIEASAHALRHGSSMAVWTGVTVRGARLLGDSEKTVERVCSKHSPEIVCAERWIRLMLAKPKPPLLQL